MMETSKIIINNMFSLLDNTNSDIISQFKANLILLLENEAKYNKFIYSHNDKLNENNIFLSFDNDKKDNTILIDNNLLNDLKSSDKNERYLACKKILKDFYKQLGFIRKMKLITNKTYYSNYILKLVKNYIVYNSFDNKNNKYINDEVTRIIKKDRNNILLKYPILTLEYNIVSNDRKSICELYNDMKISNEKYDGELLDINKKMYYEIINDSLNYIVLEDKVELISEFNNYELLNFFEELKDYNNRNKYNNTNVNNLIKYIKDNTESDGSNIYKVIYGKDA